MAEVLRLPRMSDTMEEGVIATLHIKVGDSVSAGDIIAEVETDKATMEWESFQQGKVLYIGVKNGDTVPINALVAIIGQDGEDIQSLLNKEANATLTEIQEDEGPAVETSKEDDTENTIEFNIEQEENINNDNSERLKASPLAKKIAEEKGIDLHNIKGSGDEGRITKRDVEAFQPTMISEVSAKEGVKVQQQQIEIPQVVGAESYREEKISQVRKTIAKRLAESKYSAPHFYLTVEVNMNKTIVAREEINKQIAPSKISFNDIVIKATANAIRKNLEVNVSWLGDTIRYNEHIHIGMAVATDFGLVVPVIKFADNKSLLHIAQEAKQFAGKARDKKLTPEEMQGNTFSISNLGGFGINEFTAIINPPDSCILAVGGIKKELGYNENKEIVENNIMKLTLSCDHRTVDGAVGAKFLNTLKANLENPLMMLV